MTSVSGTVRMPNGQLPVAGADVYVPNQSTEEPWGLTPFKDGVAEGACNCGIQESPLVFTTTGADGTFRLTDVPVGTTFPLVVQVGRWRRVAKIPSLAACSNTEIDENLTRLPRVQGESHPLDSIPLMALATGRDDALECVLRKMGVADSEFSNAGGTGRLRFYRDNGASCTDGGGSCTGTTPSYRQLTATQAEIDQYDAVLYPCDGVAHDEPGADKSRLLDNPTNPRAYVNKGGRALFTHFSYAWLYNQLPSMQLPWMSTTVSANVNAAWGPVAAQVDAGSVHSYRFAAWLALPIVGAMSSLSPLRIKLEESSRNLDNPSDWLDPWGNPAVPAQRWLFGDTTAPSDPAPAAAMLYVSMDTPPGHYIYLPCGRVHFGSFHAAPKGDTSERLFPAECDQTFSPNEKAVAFMLLDLMSCMTGIGHGCDTIPWGRCDVPFSCEDACGTNSAGRFNCRPVQRAEYTTPCLYDDGMGGILQCYCTSS